MTVANLAYNLEPEIVLKQREGSPIEEVSVTNTLTVIYEKVNKSEIKMCLLYFLMQGLIVPNFDDIHYMFLTDS